MTLDANPPTRVQTLEALFQSHCSCLTQDSFQKSNKSDQFINGFLMRLNSNASLSVEKQEFTENTREGVSRTFKNAKRKYRIFFNEKKTFFYASIICTDNYKTQFGCASHQHQCRD